MRVCVPRESAPGEHRVALTPETVAKLGNGGFELVVERGAGVLAGFPDELYANAGARLADFPGALDGVEGIVRVGPPAGDEVAAYAPGTVLVGFLQPLTDTEGIERLRERGVVAFAMESIPRITRAQTMDALSSQATIAGIASRISDACAVSTKREIDQTMTYRPKSSSGSHSTQRIVSRKFAVLARP